MALIPSFTVSQPAGTPDTIRITDTSVPISGGDPSVTGRLVYLLKSDGTYLVPAGTTTNYVEWELQDSFIDIVCLDKDYALNITVEWVRVSNTPLSSTNIYGLTAYNEDFDYTLSSLLASNPLLVNDNSFESNKTKLRLYIDSGNQAIALASDITSAQLCYDKGTELRINSQYFFNASQ